MVPLGLVAVSVEKGCNYLAGAGEFETNPDNGAPAR
jgi:hypothetical protein